jgi:hypothetical protein
LSALASIRAVGWRLEISIFMQGLPQARRARGISMP